MRQSKFLNLILGGFLALTACAPKNDALKITSSADANSDRAKEREFSQFWLSTSSGEKPHLALAILLRSFMSKEIKNDFEKGLPQDVDVSRIFYEERSLAKRFYLAGSTPFRDNLDILNGTILYRQQHQIYSAESFLEPFNWSLQARMQQQAYDDLLKSFQQRATDLARVIAPQLLQVLPRKEVQIINKPFLDRTEKVQVIFDIIKKYDKTLSAYDFSPDDNTKLVLIGLIANVIVEEVQKNKSIDSLMNLVNDVQKIKTAIKECSSLIQIVESNRSKMRSDWNTMQKEMSAFLVDLKNLKLSLSEKTKAEGMQLIEDAIWGNLREGPGGSFLTQRQQINGHLEAFVNSAASAADGLNNIVNATDKLTQVLGIKLDPQVKEAINTARQVASTVSLAKNLLSAYATGGVVGALGVIGGGSSIGVFGASEQSAMAADIAEIKKDIKEIKRLQIQMMQMQVETMKMIRDLAVMIESYHREQMYALGEVKGISLMNFENSLIQTHKDIKSCEQMLEFSFRRNSELEGNPFSLGSIQTLDLGREVVFAPLKDKNQLKSFIQSTGENTFESCQDGINNAFARAQTNESPLQLVAQGGDLNPLALFYREKYWPLLSYLEGIQHSKKISALGLHVPSANIETLMKKQFYADSPIAQESYGYDQLKNLISTVLLERYSETLFLLGPLISYDKSNWINFISNQNALKENFDLAWTRNYTWLKNALYLTQIALAQEAVLSGEPLLPDLSLHFLEFLQAKEVCSTNTSNLRCAVITNKVLRRNLLMFILNQRVQKYFKSLDYQTAFKQKDIQTLSQILGKEFSGRLQVKNDSLVFVWAAGNSELVTPMPTIQEIWDGELEYSKNISRLVTLQEKLANSLLELTPMNIDQEKKGVFSKVVLIK